MDTPETDVDLSEYREAVVAEFEASLSERDLKRKKVTDILEEGAVEAATTLVKACRYSDKWADRIRASTWLLDHYLNTKEDDPVNDFLKKLAEVGTPETADAE